MSDGIPVTVLSGPLGAGKTTVVNHLLENAGGRSIAVLVNDMGDVNVDAELLAAGSDLAADGGIAELSNGCICCELQDDLETEVARLASERDFEYLVVEASGISEPAPVARLFTTASRAAAAYDLDTLVTVVDADLFARTFGDRDRAERETAPGSSDRPLSDLLVEQVEVANVILLNKCDLVDEETLAHVEELVGALAPEARLVRTVHGSVDPEAILGTGLFDPDRFGASAGWQRALADAQAHDEDRAHDHDADVDVDGHDGHDSDLDHDDHGHDDHDHDHDHDHVHAHPEEVYGVTSFTYRRRRPFHPERFRALLEDLPEAVVRAKGLCWVAGREETALLLSQAGANVRVESFGPWLASLPEIERDLYREGRPEVEWDDDHGDRRTELVFIGHDLGEALVERLDDCLVPEAEWHEWPPEGEVEDAADPFPVLGEGPLEFAIR